MARKEATGKAAARPCGGFWAAVAGVDTLSVRLEDGLVGLVGVLHGDGVGKLVQHPLLEGLQPLVVMPAAHELLVLEVKQQKA